jgi:hypothetical protein
MVDRVLIMCEYSFADISEEEYLFFARDVVAFLDSTGMRRITTFRLTTDRIHDSGPIIL